MPFDKVLDNIEEQLAYIDIHCHKHSQDLGIEIQSIDTLDFNPEAPDPGYYSLGIHPWFIERQDYQIALDKVTVAGDKPKLLAIGECGLDKTITTSMKLQQTVFNSQIELAERLGKPLIIHCVKAFNELIQIKKTRKAKSAWIIHGFNGNPALAKQCLKHDCYLSFGKALLNPRSHAQQALTEMPLDRLFLETDTTEMPISALYAAAAKILDFDIATLQQQILSNFNRVFLND